MLIGEKKFFLCLCKCVYLCVSEGRVKVNFYSWYEWRDWEKNLVKMCLFV